jgi:putative membrane protein
MGVLYHAPCGGGAWPERTAPAKRWESRGAARDEGLQVEDAMKLSHVALGLALFTAPVLADTSAPKLAADDLAIIAHEHAVNQAEIHAGRLAENNSSNGNVRDFGKELVADHQNADDNLLAFARAHDAVVAKDVATTDAERKAQADDAAGMTQLKALKGPAFDAKFLDMMVAGHAREIGTLDAFAARTGDAGMKALLTATRPVMVTHEETAKSLEQATPRT